MATTRVVHLLEGMAKQVQQDADNEEQLFNKYRCWANTIVVSKEASNEASTSRKEQLETHLSALEGDTLELTTERTDLEKEIKEHKSSKESTDRALEAQELSCNSNKADLEKTITALKNAIQVLKKAEAPGEENQQTGLLTSRRVENQALTGFTARAAEADSLSRAVELGATVLDRQDESFLRRVLTGQVPLDMKKLTDTAKVRGSYQGRAKKIVDVLTSLKSKTQIHLDDVTKACKKSKDELGLLLEANTQALNTATQAQTAATGEKAAKSLSKADADEQIASLNKQIDADTTFIQETKDALTLKETEWSKRQKVRAEELEAISKAVAILSADEARDTFKESFESQNQGAAFVQLASSQHAVKAVKAVAVLESVGLHARDPRASALALMLAGQQRDSNLVLESQGPVQIAAESNSPVESKFGDFQKVLEAIDALLEQLTADDTADLERKEKCETDGASSKSEAITYARAMDGFSDSMSAQRVVIAESQAEIEVQNETIANLEAKQTEADLLRTAENKQHQVDNGHDLDAAATVKQAIEVLQQFYTPSDTASEESLIQGGGRHGQAAVAVAGQAPPPPPTTWSGTYGGKATESTGVVAILSMIASDIEKDRNVGVASEAAALAAYEAFKVENEAAINAARDAVEAQDELVSAAQTKIAEDQASKNGQHKLLGLEVATIKGLTPGCDATTINYPVRKMNRATEADGLRKAKTILGGGHFDEKDAGRPLEVGDAFPQTKSNGFLSRVRAH